MEALVQAVAAKTGLPPAQARQAAAAVIDFISERLPAPLAKQVAAALSESDAPSGADLLQSARGLFGG